MALQTSCGLESKLEVTIRAAHCGIKLRGATSRQTFVLPFFRDHGYFM